ncbi:CRAL-TRIO lipid binding domain, partial [Trinorchestia longiramus]
DAFPLRLSALHLLNGPWWTGTALRFARPFIKEKTRGRIHVHGNNLSSLHKHLPPRLLPAQLGGEGGEYKPAKWADTVLDLAGKPCKIITRSSESSRKEKEGDVFFSTDSNCSVKSKEDREECEKNKKRLEKENDVESSSRNEEYNEEEDDDTDDIVPTKRFTFENLIKSGARKFQLAQMTEGSDGFTLKKLKSLSMDSSRYSPTNKSSSSVFNFTRSKSMSATTREHDDEYGDDDNDDDEGSCVRDGETNVYNFPKPKSPQRGASTITSLSNNMNKMKLNILSMDKSKSYDQGQPSSRLLLANDSVMPT